jgi:dolichol-phosphate mannosyltransferase
MVVMTALFGILFVLLGIVGEYIGRILVEVRRRPRFLVSDELGVQETPDTEERGHIEG